MAAVAGVISPARGVAAPPSRTTYPPMVRLMGSVTNAMWPIGDVPAMERSAAYARSMGVTAYESYVPWSVIEPRRKGEFDWTETDKLDGICRRTGLKWQILFMMNPSYATPKWYRESGEDVPFRCLEHNQDSDIRSIWCPGLDGHRDRLLRAIYGRYGKSPALESVMLSVSGDFGETLYPAGALGWNGQFHNHAGYWCGDPSARKAFRQWARSRFTTIARLNRAWGTRYRSFDEVAFQLPSPALSDARWLDQAEWYRGEMTEYSARWIRMARKYAPANIPLYICVGGDDNVIIGFDITGQVKRFSAYNTWFRLTNEGSRYAENFMITRQLTTAAKLNGQPYGLEPASDVTAKGVTARIYGSAAAGCNHLHHYDGQAADFRSAKPISDRTDRWTTGQRFLRVKAPYVNVAAFFPRIDTICRRENGTSALRPYSSLRDRIDFDMVDDNLVRDGRIGRYRYLLLGPCGTMDAGAYRGLMDWVRAGGVLLTSEQRPIRLWNAGSCSFTTAAPLVRKAAPWASISVTSCRLLELHPGAMPEYAELIGNWSHSEGNHRWGGKDAGIRIPVDPSLDYTLTYQGGIAGDGVVMANGTVIAHTTATSGTDNRWTWRIPASALKGRNMLQLDFRVAPYITPNDSRDLCVYPHTLRLEAVDGAANLTAPAVGKARIDRARLAAATRRVGRGAVVALSGTSLSGAQLAAVVTEYIRQAPGGCVPDGVGDGLFAACRGDEVLVYNSSDQVVSTQLSIPAGAELDRMTRAAGQVIRIRDMAPNSIATYPLRLARPIR